MSRICCKLHRFMDLPEFTSKLNNDKFQDFCAYLQMSCQKRNRSLLPLKNPNEKEVFIYLFGGVGTRYLTTVLGEFITFVPETKSNKTRWFPVVGIKKTSQTKSLTILGSGTLPIALLLLLSYHENNIKKHLECSTFDLITHMSANKLIPCLLFLLRQTNNTTLQNILIKKMTAITLCDNNNDINTFITESFSRSFANHHKTITDRFDSHLTLYCTEEREKTQQEDIEQQWKTKLLTYLMMTNWTGTHCGYKNSCKNAVMETSTSPEYQLQPPPPTLQTQILPMIPTPYLLPSQIPSMMTDKWNQIVPTHGISEQQTHLCQPNQATPETTNWHSPFK